MKTLLILLLLLATLSVAQTPPATSTAVSVTITAVHDGDSYRVLTPDGDRYWVRLLFVDSPEVVSPYVSTSQPYGVSAGAGVRELIKGQTLSMLVCGADMFARPLVILRLPGGARLDSTIIANGWGWYRAKGSVKLPPNERMLYGRNLEKTARRSGAGLWGLPRPVDPAKWRKANSGN